MSIVRFSRLLRIVPPDTGKPLNKWFFVEVSGYLEFQISEGRNVELGNQNEE